MIIGIRPIIKSQFNQLYRISNKNLNYFVLNKSFGMMSDMNKSNESKDKNNNNNNDPTPNHRPLLMIPGPIEYEQSVLHMLGSPTVSHVSPLFISDFGSVIKNLRIIFNGPKSQPLVLSGSGTLGWDCLLANLCEEKDNLLVVNTGYFSLYK
jgi:hypothetical protein